MSVPGPGRWRTIEPIIDALLELPPEDRDAYARSACADDAPLLAEIRRLLAAHDGPDAALDQPAAQRFASLLDDGPAHLPEVLVGRYRIGRVLGRGGMATVFLGDDIRHDRQVAVKVLHAELAAALGSELFLAEIKTTAQLQHSHILPLHDSGDADGLLFYVMPYVPDGTLRQRLSQEKPLLIDEAVRITSEVASALDAAHRRGVIHRDIKPENILLHDGTALVADFGIALAVSAVAAARLEKPGLILGTRQYMSPEQAAAGALDGRADVYSLGVVVQEMVAIIRTSSEIPAAVDVVIARALSPAAEDRYASAGEFAGALQRATVPTVARRIARRPVPVLIGLALVLVAGIALVDRPRAAAPQRRMKANQQAIDLYNQGTAWLDRRTTEGGIKAEQYFRQAIAADSTFSEAYSGLADTYTFYGIGNIGDYYPNEYFPKARSAAQHALDLDTTSAEAHVALAQVRMFYDFDWAGAERDLQRSKELDPQYVPGRGITIILSEFTGRFDRAIAEAREAVRIDKLTMQWNIELGRALFFARRYDDAVVQLTRTIERDSTQYRAYLVLGQALSQQRKHDSAISAMRASVRLAPGSSRAHAYLANTYARAGRTGEALDELHALEEKARHVYVPAFDFAVVYAGLDSTDETLDWLGKAVDDHSMRPYIQDATFDAIRSDQRYATLQARLHLPFPGLAR